VDSSEPDRESVIDVVVGERGFARNAGRLREICDLPGRAAPEDAEDVLDDGWRYHSLIPLVLDHHRRRGTGDVFDDGWGYYHLIPHEEVLWGNDTKIHRGYYAMWQTFLAIAKS
jgi:hypothetical protein